MSAPALRGLQKVLGWSLLVLLLVLLLALLATTWIVQTDSGSRWAIATARQYLPAELQLGLVSGKLASPLTLRDVHFESPGARLTIDEMTVRWQLFDLLDSAVTIEQLQVQGLTLALQPTAEPPSTEPVSLPRLPVSIDLQQLRVRDARILSAPQAEPLAIAELDATARWNHEQLALHDLRLRAPLADLDGALQLGFPSVLGMPAGLGESALGVAELSASQLQLELDFQLRMADLAPVNGSLAGSGPLADLQMKLVAAAPYGFELAGAIEGLLELPKVDLTIRADTAALGQISPGWPALQLGLRGAIQGSGSELTLLLNGDSAALAGPAALGNGRGVLELVYSPERLRIVTASFQELLVSDATELVHPNTSQAQPGAMQVQGLIELSGPAPALDVAAQWQHLRWPMDQRPQLQSARGELTLLGTTADYRLQLDAQLAVPEQSDGVLKATGQGSQTAFTLDSLAVAALGGTAVVSGSASWNDGVNATAQWQVNDLNPGVLLPDWPGAVSAQGSVTVQQDHAAAPVAIAIADVELGGLLRDAALAGAIDLDYRAPGLVIDQAQLALGENRLVVTGGVDAQQRYDLQFEVAAPALELLAPGSSGSVSAKGTVTGFAAAPVLQATASAEDVQTGQLRLGTLALAADVGVAPSHNNQIDVQLEQLRSAGLGLDRAAVQLSGPQTAHALSLQLQADSAQVAVTLAGGTADLRQFAEAQGSYAFSVQQLDLEQADQPPWQLESAADLRPEGQVTAESAAVESLCLRSADSRACVSGRWLGAGNLQAQVALESVSLAHFDALLPPELALSGHLDGGGTIALQDRQPRADLTLTSSAIDVLSADAPSAGPEAALVRFAPGRLELAGADPTPLQLLLDLPLDTAAGSTPGGLQAQIRISPGVGDLDQSALAGSVTAKVADLSGVAALVPEVSRLAGSLDSLVELGGTVAAPLLTGHLRLRDGEAALTGAGITARQIELEVSTEQRAATAPGTPVPLRLQGSVVSGGGPLTVDGNLLYTGTELAGTVALVGERFRLLNNDQAELYISPELTIALADQALQVRGVVTVPEADIALKSLPESAVVVTDDQVIVGTEPAANGSGPYTYDAQVTLSLGDKVHFEGFGLDADFAGDLRISQGSGEPALGRGEIRITKGRYQAYGQDLSIETGRALWTSSPLALPGIDLRAIRKPRPDVVVGVQARGRLSQPEFSLFSEPTLSESDQLSYLVLGRPLEDNSSAENSLVSQAALALGIRGGNFLSDQFGDKLGVDRMGVETEAGAGTSGAAFVVGKYLSPKLYVSYGLGLLDSVSTLKLEYLLSSKWRLVSQSSTLDSGGDLIYTIERK